MQLVAVTVTSVASCACASLQTEGIADRPTNAGAAVRGVVGRAALLPAASLLERSGVKPESLMANHLARESAITGTPLLAGNRVTLLEDGPSTYQAMLSAIAGARDHINMETYILDDDEIGRQFAQALIARQKAGVQVNLIHDSIGTLATPVAFFEGLRQAGIQVLEFNPVNPLRTQGPWALNQRDHRKLLIVDGHTAIVGGINISGVYSGSSLGKRRAAQSSSSAPWRDTDLQVQGPVVAEFQKLFVAAWNAQSHWPLAGRAYFPKLPVVGTQLVRAIGSVPEDGDSPIFRTLLSAIASARHTVRLTNAYFVPDPALLDALEAAVARGVDVTLIVPGRSDSWLVLYAAHSYYERMLRAGVRLYERREVILHSKTVLIDEVWATVGSSNHDWRSVLHNHELAAVVLGTEFGAQMRALFERDIQGSEELTLARWSARPVEMRIKEWLSNVWRYWL